MIFRVGTAEVVELVVRGLFCKVVLGLVKLFRVVVKGCGTFFF